MEQIKKSENSKVAKAAGIVSAATMVSRVFGLVRDMVIAAFFGATWMSDAFWVAFRIPNTLSRLLGEGALTASFIPVFTEYLQKKKERRGIGAGVQHLYASLYYFDVCLRAGHYFLTIDCPADRAGFHFRSQTIRTGSFS